MGRQKELGTVLHYYQPERDVPLPSSERILVFPEINEVIYRQSYRPILVEGGGLPVGMVFSFFATLREWIRVNHPTDFEIIKRKIRALPNREYLVLGDPLVHLILPFMDTDDLDILVGAGKKAFIEDFGFTPLGFWPPEMAVSYQVLRVLAKHGYRFMALRDFQVEGRSTNPVKVKLPDERDMAVLRCDSGWSGAVAFDDRLTVNGDLFLDRVLQSHGYEVIFCADGETFGHHKYGRENFLRYVFNGETLRKRGVAPLDMKERMTSWGKDEAHLWEYTSWSCPHNLGRWSNGCPCDNPSEKALSDKRVFYEKLTWLKQIVKGELDRINPHWKSEFTDLLVKNRHYLFGVSKQNEVEYIGKNERLKRLYLALMYVYVGMTSCGWFFGGDDRPERLIPAMTIEAIETLLA